ncbi:hypothetical protein TELCIR_11360 [Teladorsagia circumcincta]|uniref:STAR protein homodimerisation region domain-containing protein n=1 Tax=Teladorsagia circumcincta TaxID=45464 RepID=A0A2G9U9K3_TELCI|nr:hypothetical protein TELCIR_11360 [Teladorsagia circumcincta]
MDCSLEYLADLVKEKKDLEMFVDNFQHVERLLNEVQLRWSDSRTPWYDSETTGARNWLQNYANSNRIITPVPLVSPIRAPIFVSPTSSPNNGVVQKPSNPGYIGANSQQPFDYSSFMKRQHFSFVGVDK